MDLKSRRTLLAILAGLILATLGTLLLKMACWGILLGVVVSAVLALTKCMALELAPAIRVNTVTPGRIDTEELRERYHLDAAGNRECFEQETPLARLGKPEEVAAMILFLVESGQYITGQNFFVDGGLFMR